MPTAKPVFVRLAGPDAVHGDPEIGQEGVLVALAHGDQDVARLHVAMDEPVAVGLGEGLCDLGDDPDGAGRLEPSFLGEQGAQVGPVDVAHRQVERPALGARVEDLDDVRVVQRGGEPALALEAGAEDGISSQARHQELQCDGPVEGQVGGPVDDAHSAASRDRVDAVTGERGADRELPRRPPRLGSGRRASRRSRSAPRFGFR